MFVFVAVRRQVGDRIEVCVCICVCVEEQASDRYRDSYARDPSGNLGKTAENKFIFLVTQRSEPPTTLTRTYRVAWQLTWKF